MKKTTLGLSLILSTLLTFGQENFPTYPKMLRAFFYHYQAENSNDTFINFAKKKEGWFIQLIDRYKSDSVWKEILFWSAQKKAYVDPGNIFPRKDNAEEGEKKVGDYLNGNYALNPWIEYERCKYAGYQYAARDMIREYAGRSSLSDTLLEGLGRSYSLEAGNYLWYTNQIILKENDSMRLPLQRLEMPGRDRLDSVNALILKSTETFDRLLKQNPTYISTVGNIHLKKFNQYMHGYNLMIMAMQDERAGAYIQKAELAEPYIKQAKNYLNSCDKNGILFSFGDNDTYQLWYVQEKEHFRKDVTVINLSLLNLPAYVDMIKKRNEVIFSTPGTFYGDAVNDVIYFKEPVEKEKKEMMDLKSVIKKVNSGEEKAETIANRFAPAYTVQKTWISINRNEFNTISSIKINSDKIYLELKNYLFFSDLIMLDLIANNINKRPVYFTNASPDYFSENLIQQGIVYRLTPIEDENKDLIETKEIKALEKFVDSIYTPVVSFNVNGIKNTSIDGNNVFFQLYYKLADYYTEKNDKKNAQAWINKVKTFVPEVSGENLPAALNLGLACIKYDKVLARQIIEQYLAYSYSKCVNPTAIKGYLSMAECLDTLNSYRQYFEQENMNTSVINSLIEHLKDSRP